MRRFLMILFLAFTFNSAFAQTRADRLFDRGDYLAALQLYQKELDGIGENKGEKSDLLKARIANCLFRLNNVVKAGQVYKTIDQNLLGAEDLTFYASTLLRAGEYDKAAGLVDVVESLGGDVVIVERMRASCEFAKEVVKEKPVYTANKLNIDFAGVSSGVTYYKNNGVILAAPGTGDKAQKDSRGYKVTRLYNVIFTPSGGRMIPFADDLADKYHIGAVTFTQDFKRIYYTRTILKNDGSSILKLMTAEETDGKWGNIEELSVNSDDYSCAHPCLYKDSLLYFVSDMPGGIGGKDIYVTTVDGAMCGEVENLGETVNTMFDELFPFVDTEGNLYFASNGHVGLGGLDVFVARKQFDGSWTEPENMGRPVNSSMDDFALVFKDAKCTEGFVSSNRGGTGYNDFLFSLKQLPNRKAAKKELEKVTHEKSQGDPALEVDYRYAIQIGAFRYPVPRVYFDHFQNVKVYLGYDNIYRYTVGEYPEENIAKMELSQVQKIIGDAFVIGVDKYIVEKKIQNGVKGDDISDNELLLRRLKSFESMKKRRDLAPVSTKRYIDKPQDNEMGIVSEAYTIVLMVSDRMMDLERFEGIGEVDVYAVNSGKYMYCSGLYASPEEAVARLGRVKQQGFQDARVINADTYEYYNKSRTESKVPVRTASRHDANSLKKILNY